MRERERGRESGARIEERERENGQIGGELQTASSTLQCKGGASGNLFCDNTTISDDDEEEEFV